MKIPDPRSARFSIRFKWWSPALGSAIQEDACFCDTKTILTRQWPPLLLSDSTCVSFDAADGLDDIGLQILKEKKYPDCSWICEEVWNEALAEGVEVALDLHVWMGLVEVLYLCRHLPAKVRDESYIMGESWLSRWSPLGLVIQYTKTQVEEMGWIGPVGESHLVGTTSSPPSHGQFFLHGGLSSYSRDLQLQNHEMSGELFVDSKTNVLLRIRTCAIPSILPPAMSIISPQASSLNGWYTFCHNKLLPTRQKDRRGVSLTFWGFASIFTRVPC